MSRPSGRFLAVVHLPKPNAPKQLYITACGRRGFTSTDKAEITCKRCAAKVKVSA